jgi:hypothetical protein
MEHDWFLVVVRFDSGGWIYRCASCGLDVNEDYIRARHPCLSVPRDEAAART